MQKLKFVGLSGYATVGKDLFFSILSSHYPSTRFSLGDILKAEVREKILEEESVDILNCNSQDKKKVRPKLVEYGEARRTETKGKYFTDKMNKIISNTFTLSRIPVITDIRYKEYENDELEWLKNDLDGVLVYIKKYKIISGERVYVEPPNESEKSNDPFLRENADYTVDWEEVESAKDFSEVRASLDPHIKKFIDWYSEVL
jgi:hypothetical protein